VLTCNDVDYQRTLWTATLDLAAYHTCCLRCTWCVSECWCGVGQCGVAKAIRPPHKRGAAGIKRCLQNMSIIEALREFVVVRCRGLPVSGVIVFGPGCVLFPWCSVPAGFCMQHKVALLQCQRQVVLYLHETEGRLHPPCHRCGCPTARRQNTSTWTPALETEGDAASAAAG
jgi:hypothetical protein